MEVTVADVEKIRGEFDKTASDFISVAVELSITNQESMDNATKFMRKILDAKKRVSDLFDPVIKKLHESHKSTIRLRDDILSPFNRAEIIIRPKIQGYLVDQENKRMAMQEALEEASEEGLPAPILPPAQKPDGVTTRRVLKIRVTDLHALCIAVTKGLAPIECIIADESFIRTLARKRGTENIGLPGVEAYYEDTLVVR